MTIRMSRRELLAAIGLAAAGCRAAAPAAQKRPEEGGLATVRLTISGMR